MKFIREFIQKRLPDSQSSKYLGEGFEEGKNTMNFNQSEEIVTVD
jgi:hypothetical protein